MILGQRQPSRSPSGWHSHTRDILADVGSFADMREEAFQRELVALTAEAGVATNRNLQRRTRAAARQQKVSALPETAFDELTRKRAAKELRLGNPGWFRAGQISTYISIS